MMESSEGNFIFVTTETGYKKLSDTAIKHQMSVADFVSAALEYFIELKEAQKGVLK